MTVSVIISVIYDLMFILPLSLAAASAVYPFVPGVSEAVWLLAIVSASVILVLLRHLKLRERLLLAGIVVTAFAAVIFYQGSGERLKFLSSHVWAVKDVGIALACFTVCVISSRFRILRTVIAAAGLIMLPASLFFGNRLGKLCVCSIFAYVLIVLIDEVHNRSDKEGNTDIHSHLVFTAPFLLAAFVVIAAVKIPGRPYGWGFVKAAASSVQSTIARISDMISGIDRDSDAPFIGFSDRGNLSGRLRGSGYTVMDLTSSAQGEPILYLSGRVFESFDGHEWTDTDTDNDTVTENDEGTQADDVLFDTLVTLSACIDASDDLLLSDVARSVKLTVDQKSISDDGTFIPPKSIPPEYDAIRAGDDRQVRYYRINMASPAFTDLCENGHIVTPESLEAAVLESDLEKDSAAERDDINTRYEKYKAYDLRMHDKYMPETVISDKLRAYIDEMLSGCGSDLEKLLRIEGLLRSFEYSDNPGPLPENIAGPSQYLDHFIFEKKSGYCSYYATAFVLLARAYGIPARYVQGYRVEMRDKLHVPVSSADAHAWPEAYLSGIGWVTFEPTPGIEGMLDTSGWKIHGNMSSYPVSAGKDEKISDAADDDTAEPDAVAKRFNINWRRIAVPVLFGAVFTGLLFLADALLKRRRYNMLSEHGKALWHCRQNMQLLRKKGYPRLANETLSEYEKRLGDTLGPEITGFISTYEKLLYSLPGSVRDTETDAIAASYTAIKKTLKRKRYSHHI
ncbi:MAG: DUF3488 and transglutaminase-like domain-containing protein [Lachnospiraceae bacterium]|nr:DUF3488 and transglutaminase-like domain-containing protein [Lachnospiraceae bacterium]